MVDEEIEKSIPVLLAISGQIRESKQRVLDNFRDILAMKSDLFGTVSKMTSARTLSPIQKVTSVSRWVST